METSNETVPHAPQPGRFSGARTEARDRTSVRSMRFGLIPVVYVAIAAFAATGGARPTGIGSVDAVILGACGVGLAACARRSRTIPVYIAGGTAAALQPDALPMAVGIASLVAAASLQFSSIRRYTERRAVAAAVAGGLAWCGFAGAPNGRVADVWVIPLLAFSWIVISARRNGGVAFRRRWTYVTAVTCICAFVFAALGALALVMARGDVERGTNRLDDGLAAARAGDTDPAMDQLQRGATALSNAEDRLGAFWAKPALLVPGVSQHVRSLDTTVSAASSVADVAAATADEVDLEGLGASAGQLDPVAIAAVADPLGDLIAALERARSDIAEVGDAWLLSVVRDQIDEAEDKLADASESAMLAHQGVSVVPAMIGLNGPRTYLVLFTSPVEARARTGFPANYAEIRFEGGEFDMTRFGPISDLNAPLPDDGVDLDLDEEYRTRYERFGVEFIWQNITMSPDFPTVADVARQLYAAGGFGEVDGVLSVNPRALAAMLELTGPISVPEAGVTLDADNAEQYLVHDQYLEFETDNPERKDVLEFLAEDAFNALASADLPGPRGLRRVLGPTVERGDLQFYAFAPAEAEFLADVGIDGGFERTTDDFLAVTTTNAAGNKIDVFMEKTVAYDVEWDVDSGRIDATATVTLTNTAPATGLPPYLIDNALGRRPLDVELPPGSNYLFVTLYSPWLAEGATLAGTTTGLERQPELGLNAYSLFVTVAPGQTQTLTVDLTGQLDDFTYDLDVVPQPSVTADRFSFQLEADGRGELDVVTRPQDTDVSAEIEGRRAELFTETDRSLRIVAQMSGG